MLPLAWQAELQKRPGNEEHEGLRMAEAYAHGPRSQLIQERVLDQSAAWMTHSTQGVAKDNFWRNETTKNIFMRRTPIHEKRNCEFSRTPCLENLGGGLRAITLGEVCGLFSIVPVEQRHHRA
jgi:hypothetical protein